MRAPLTETLPRTLALMLALTLGAAGCGGFGADGTGDERRELTVLAAASLTESFTALAEQYEEQHPDVDVRLAFDSSATLAGQVLEGAPADVLATADAATMATAAPALASEPVVVATNTMVLVIPAANPGAVDDFDDVASGDLTWVACVATAPCGRVWAALAAANDVTSSPASLEVDVKAVLAKVTSGEADAGFVYRTDAVAAGARVDTLPVPGADRQITRYPVATVAGGDTDLADTFVALVASPAGQQVLADAGFGPP